MKRLRLQALVLCFLLLFGQSAFAGPGATINGKVLEKGTGRPLDGITVFLMETESEGAVSGDDGSFSIEVPGPGTFKLVGAGVGYKKSEPMPINVRDAGILPFVTIYLEPENTLADIVVSAHRNPDRTAKTVISGKEAVKVAGSIGDPLKGMMSLPGITTINDTSSNPAIRGSGPADNFYYLDFLPVGYLFHMGGIVSVLNADIVDDFNIYSAAFGPEFADVTGAIIDVKLREPRNDRFVRKVNMSIYEADLLVEGPIGNNQSFFFGARRSYIDLFLPKTGRLGDSGGEYRQFPNFYDYQGKYVWKISDRHTLNFLINGAKDSMTLYFPSDSDIARHDPILAGDFNNEQSYNIQGAVLSSRVSQNINNRIGVSYSDSEIRQSLTQLGHAIADIRGLFLREQMNIRPSEYHEIIIEGEAGRSYVNLNIDVTNAMPSDFTPLPDNTSANRVTNNESFSPSYGSIGIKERWRVLQPLTLVIGGRGGYSGYFNRYYADPRLALEYSVNRDNLVTAGWGRYHQFPEGFQVIRNMGNPDIDFIKAEHYVLGLDSRLTEGWQLKVEGYYKNLFDLVVPHQPENYLNGGSGKAYGLELLIKKNQTSNWSGWLSLSRAYTERRNDLTGESFPYRYDQPVIANLVCNYKFSDRWTLGGKWRYQSGAPFTPVIGTYVDSSSRTRPVYGNLGSERLPDYHRLDLRLDREFIFNTWKMSIYWEVINAYARENVSGYQYNFAYTDRKPVKQLPLMPSVGIQAEF